MIFDTVSSVSAAYKQYCTVKYKLFYQQMMKNATQECKNLNKLSEMHPNVKHLSLFCVPIQNIASFLVSDNFFWT